METNYKQKYEEALKKAEAYHNDYTKDIIEDIFPELKESSSEDEDIRKALIRAFESLNTIKVWNGIKRTDILSWLEKQCNQKVTIDFKSKDWYVSKVDNKIHNITYNPTDNNKLKFNIGDWVIVTTGTDEHTVEIIDISYFRDCHPMYITSEGRWFGNGTKALLWNINYAKDGDTLCYNDEVFIYKNFDNSIGYYACWDGKNIHLNSFYSLTLEEMKKVKPATKEQRRELLKHLNKAGYIWSNERKELFTLNKDDYFI